MLLNTTSSKEVQDTKMKATKSENIGMKRSKGETKSRDVKRLKTEVVIEKREMKDSWLKIFEPKKISDLMLHVKKLEDIRSWFKLTRESSIFNRILLLTGPTGCLKLSTVRLVANEANYVVKEWMSSTIIDRELLHDENFPMYEAQPNQADKFKNYLIRSSNYGTLFAQGDCVIVIKDFPNIFLRKGCEEEFSEILTLYKKKGCAPLIFILTESQSKSSNLEYRLFPDTLRTELGIEAIVMNPISATNMKRALKKICATVQASIENFQQPSEDTIESIVAQSQGDIRNAVNNLQLITQQGDFSKIVSKRCAKKAGKPEKAIARAKIDQGVGKDELLDILHGVGRALYPKWEVNAATKQTMLTRRPEDLADIFQTQSANYIELVHSNYLKRFSNIDDICAVTDTLTMSDIFQSEYRDGDRLQLINLNMVIRAVMVSNSQPAGGFNPISAYASKKFKSNEEKYRTKFEAFKLKNVHVNKKDFYSDYSIFK